MVETNLLGAMTTLEVFLDQLRDGGGDLVNISSVAGRTAKPGSSVYNATKWGLNGWSEALRQELKDDGIRVIVIEPGAIATELTDHITDEQVKKGAEEMYERDAIPVEDVADVIALRRRPSGPDLAQRDHHPADQPDVVVADRLDRYKGKRDFDETPEPVGDETSGRRRAVRDPAARRHQPALGPAPGARRGARLLGAAPRRPRPPRREPAGGPHRGPPAGVPRVPRRDPQGLIRRGHDGDLGPRHLRLREVPRRRGDRGPGGRAGAGALRAHPDQGQELADPPHGPAGRSRSRADARPDRADEGDDRDAASRRRQVRLRDQVGRRARGRAPGPGPRRGLRPLGRRLHLSLSRAAPAGPRGRARSG